MKRAAKTKEVGFPKAAIAEFSAQFAQPAAFPKIPGDLNFLSNRERRRRARQDRNFTPFAFPEFPKAAVPSEAKLQLAQDNALAELANWGTGNIYEGYGEASAAFAEGMTFLGYTYLALLAQRPEYRIICETIATEMTRKWIKFQSKSTDKVDGEKKDEEKLDEDLDDNEEDADGAGEKDDVVAGAEDRAPDNLRADVPPEEEAAKEEALVEGAIEKDDEGDEPEEKGDDKSEKIKLLETFFEKLNVRDNFATIAKYDGFMGRAHLFLDFGDASEETELKTAIGTGDDKVSPTKCSPERPLVRLQPVEAMWCYPTGYNSTNPLAADWYKPQNWYAMGKQVHVTRLLPFVGREVPDQLKPAYAFGGLALTQMAQPYVDNWLRTRQSVSDIIHSFSVMVLKSNMASLLGGNGDQLIKRADLFNATRDNKGLMIIDKDTEEFANVSASLASLDKLQAQSQEHMCSVSRIPLVKFTGITPSGLNASSEGEMRAFYDTIHAYQETFFRPNLTTVFYFAQLSLFGKIDPDLTFVFEPLWSLDAKQEAEVRKIDAETDSIQIGDGVISPEESRKRVATDPTTPHKALDVADLPEPPAQPGMEDGGEVDEDGTDDGGSPAGGNKPGVGQDAVIPFSRARERRLAADGWNETDHPRGQPGNAGQFGPGAGGGGEKKEPKQKIQAPQFGMPGGLFTASQSEPKTYTAKPPKTNMGAELDHKSLTKVGEKKGSNPGGTFKDASGKEFYVKEGKSKDHVRNEMTAAALYDLAGTPTLNYRPVTGGTHIATEIEKLDKDNASKLSPAEKKEASRDLAVHAWLANWDAVGTGGDNLGTVGGVPVPLDLGGALEYRAMGSPKGKAFGEKVTELDTLRDPKMNPDGAKVFGDMTPAQIRESIRYVTTIPDSRIKSTVEKFGGDKALAEKLIARKNDLAAQAKMVGNEGDPKKPTSTMVVPADGKMPVKELNGVKFGEWEAPETLEDWATVDGQNDIDEPEFKVSTGKKPSSGVVIREPDGRIWIVQPRGGYGGYDATFPKGRLEDGLSLQANAIKEAYEESGLKVKITGHAGDHDGDMTTTRYYFAEREGGDPSLHTDETEGVVLAPTEKARGFLNRTRDRKILGGDTAMDTFNESDHPRVEGGENAGQFAKKGGETGSSKSDVSAENFGDFLEKMENLIQGGFSPAVAELADKYPAWADKAAKHDPQIGGEIEVSKEAYAKQKAEQQPKTEGQINSEYAKSISSLITKPAIAGGNYRRALIKAIKDAPKGAEEAVKILTSRLIASWGKTYANFAKKGDDKNAQKIANKIKKLGGEVPGVAIAPKPAAPVPSGKEISQKTEAIAAQAMKDNPGLAAKLKEKATPQELEKAKKNVPLQLQYVPGNEVIQTPAGKGEAQKHIDKFNEKYSGKVIAEPEKLEEKVADFKMLTAQVAIVASAEKLKAAEWAAQQKAEAAQKAAADKAKQEEQAKAHAEKNKKYMEELGITADEALGFDALVQMMSGKSGADVVAQFKGYASQAAQFGYPISGFQCALIKNYSNGGYAGINAALRSGTWTQAQHVYVKMVNKALMAMPKYEGIAHRGTQLTAADQAKYVVGNIVPEHGFTSSSSVSGFGGNTKYKIKAIGQRCADIKKLSNHTSENEVLFAARTYFKVTKVEGKPGGDMTIHMEELEDQHV